MDNCENITDLLPEYINGSISLREIAEVMSHLSRCADCRKEMSFLLSLRKASAFLDPDLPETAFVSAFVKIAPVKTTAPAAEKDLTVRQALRYISGALSTTKNVIRFSYQFL